MKAANSGDNDPAASALQPEQVNLWQNDLVQAANQAFLFACNASPLTSATASFALTALPASELSLLQS